MYNESIHKTFHETIKQRKGEMKMIDFNDKKQVAKAIQYTNVNPNLTREGLLKHLDVCMKYDFQAAMIAPCYISLAKDVLKGTGIQVASTLNFPQANDTLDMKLAALKEMMKTPRHGGRTETYRLLSGTVERHRLKTRQAANTEGFL